MRQRLRAAFRELESPQLAFNRHIIEATAEYAAAFKFNLAFYEANGADGWRQLAQSVEFLRASHPDILTICDAKRGDIGNTSAAYARAIFDQLGFDAVTLNPYLGGDALQPFLDYADRACVILCRTSNPGSAELQNLIAQDQPLWRIVAEKTVAEWNAKGNCMLVAVGDEPARTGANPRCRRRYDPARPGHRRSGRRYSIRSRSRIEPRRSRIDHQFFARHHLRR